MNFKLRLDWDCYQRVLLAVISSICLGYIMSFLMWSSVWWISVFISITSTLAVLQSSLQLEVDDKAVLITGCDTGFGLAMAKHLRGLLIVWSLRIFLVLFKGLGFTVFAGCLLADKEGEGAQELRKLSSPKLHVVQLDVTKQEEWDKVLEYVKSNTRYRIYEHSWMYNCTHESLSNIVSFSAGLWGIINNAGWATFGEVEWVSLDTYRYIFTQRYYKIVP